MSSGSAASASANVKFNVFAPFLPPSPGGGANEMSRQTRPWREEKSYFFFKRKNLHDVSLTEDFPTLGPLLQQAASRGAGESHSARVQLDSTRLEISRERATTNHKSTSKRQTKRQTKAPNKSANRPKM